MARIKLTKNELKTQRDALRRFQRYLPTLQLKKQQLQLEVRRVEGFIAEKLAQERETRARLQDWIRLFAAPFPFEEHLRVRERRLGVGNVAGVDIPVLESLTVEASPPDLFDTDPWVDDGIAVLEELLRLVIERNVLETQLRLLAEELRITNQRVNLFEKVKIPECRESIRVIRIFLGDQQTAAVARAKIAKQKMLARELTA